MTEDVYARREARRETHLAAVAHEYGGVPLEVRGHVADEVLAAVVPGWGDGLGHEENLSHPPWRTRARSFLQGLDLLSAKR